MLGGRKKKGKFFFFFFFFFSAFGMRLMEIKKEDRSGLSGVRMFEFDPACWFAF
jgi:hypothetical protein